MGAARPRRLFIGPMTVVARGRVRARFGALCHETDPPHHEKWRMRLDR